VGVKVVCVFNAVNNAALFALTVISQPAVKPPSMVVAVIVTVPELM
jgi:hypothetical protein